jgi:hypothetical protein
MVVKATPMQPGKTLPLHRYANADGEPPCCQVLWLVDCAVLALIRAYGDVCGALCARSTQRVFLLAA